MRYEQSGDAVSAAQRSELGGVPSVKPAGFPGR
jgi:hypothetical protein